MTPTFGNVRFGAVNGIAPLSTGLPPAMYPGAIADNMRLIVAVDRLQTRLVVPLAATDTAMMVQDGTGIVASCLLTIDNEIVQVQSGSGNAWQISRGFDGTAPALHLGSALVSGFIDAWHHNALVSEVQAMQIALGPNLSKIPAAPFLVSSAFDFHAQTPGGNLTVGTNVITLTPVPDGVNGTDTNHYLYISGGTGAAEAALITGGTAVAGAPSGTVIVTCSNAHSGAWTIKSATAGIQEAVVRGPSGSIIALPAGFLNVYGPIYIPCCGYTLVGQDRYGSTLVRQFAGNATMLTLSSSNIYNVGFMMGTGLVSGGSYLLITGSNQYVGRLRFSDNSLTQCSDTLITVDAAFSMIMDSIAIFTSTSNGILWKGRSSGYVTNVTSTTAAVNQVAINIQSGIMDGSNWSLQGTGSNSIGIRLAPAASGDMVSESIFSHVTLDSFAYGIFATSGPGSIASLTFSDFRIAVNGTPAIFTGPNIQDVMLHNWSVGVTSGSTIPQIRLDSGQGYTVDAVNVINGTGASGYYAIMVSENGGTTTGLAIHNSRVGMLENGTSDPGCNNGVYIGPSASDQILVSNNQLGGLTPLFTAATGTHQWYANNQGVDDAPPGMASAATLAMPLAASFALSGGVGVTAITSLKSKGSRWDFTVSASTAFTAGASIGNTITITKCGQIYYDGTKFWITGV